MDTYFISSDDQAKNWDSAWFAFQNHQHSYRPKQQKQYDIIKTNNNCWCSYYYIIIIIIIIIIIL